MAVGGAAAVVLSAFLPWAGSGSAERSGFELARTVDVLGLADAGWRRAVLVGFWLSPLLVALAWTVAVLGRARLAGALAAAVGVVAVAAAVLVLRSRAVEPLPGVWTGIVAGIAAFTAGSWLAGTRGDDAR